MGTTFKQTLAALLAVLSPLGLGQAQETERPVGLWLMYTATITRGDGPFAVGAEVQYRTHRWNRDLDQALLRLTVRYTVPDRPLTAALGYGYTYAEAAGTPDLPTREHRLYGEVGLPQRVLRARVSHRLRYEHRFFVDAPYQSRVRYALAATLPLSRRTMQPRTVYAAASAELFLRGAGRGDRPVFDRTRLHGGLGYRFSGALAAQAGVLVQVFEQTTDPQVMLSLHHTLTLR